MKMLYDHIGYLVSDINAAINAFCALGCTIEFPIAYIDSWGCYFAMLRQRELRIELVSPRPSSKIFGLTKHFNNRPFHLCFACKDLNELRTELRQEGFFPVLENQISGFLNYCKVSFYMHNAVGLIEIAEYKRIKKNWCAAFFNLYHVVNTLRYWFFEKPRGLDFSRSDYSFSSELTSANHYSRTDLSTLSQLRDHLHISKDDAFLDIGCGKGAVLTFFAESRFRRLCGIEKFEPLIQSAKKNCKILGIADRIELFCVDALDFHDYDDFNYFFMFNPFKLDIAQKIIAIIAKIPDRLQKSIRVISVQSFYNNIFNELGFQLESKFNSRLTGVYTFIFRKDCCKTKEME